VNVKDINQIGNAHIIQCSVIYILGPSQIETILDHMFNK